MPTDAKSRRRTGEKDRPDGLVPDDARMHPKKTGIRYATLIQNIEQVHTATLHPCLHLSPATPRMWS